MKLPGRSRLLLLLLAGPALFVEPLPAADWPQFRGPDRDGRSAETGLLTEWPESGPEVLWEAALGGGYSGIAVAEDRVFTLSAEKDGEALIAFDAVSGRELWRYRTDRNRADGQGGGPRSTPSVADGTVYATSAHGKLHAVDAATGEGRWQVDLVRELGATVPRWGYSSSPLVRGERLYVETGGGKGKAVVALDRNTGSLQWQSGDDTSGYSSPQVVELAGLRQLISLGGGAVSSIKPWTGRTFWSVPWETRYGVNAAMPLFVSPDKLFVASGYDVGGMMLRIGLEGGMMSINEAWRTRRMRSTFASPVAHDGALFGFDEDTLRCLDTETGKERWKVRRSAGSIIYVDGHLLVLDGSGGLFLAEATADDWVQKAEARVLKGRTWNAPALSGGVFYARSTTALVALRVGTPPGVEGQEPPE